MRKITANIITFNMQPHDLADTLRSLHASITAEHKAMAGLQNWIVVRNNGDLNIATEIVELCSEVKDVKTGDLAWLTKKWNDAVYESPTDWVMISNDDYRWRVGWFPIFNELADSGYKLIGKGFGCFLIHRELFSTVGPFDEGMKGVYFEDSDYWLRCLETGVKMSTQHGHWSHNCRLAPYFEHFHYDNLKMYAQVSGGVSAQNREANANYFYDKWKNSCNAEAQRLIKTWFPGRVNT